MEIRGRRRRERGLARPRSRRPIGLSGRGSSVRLPLEVEANLRAQRSWRHVVRAAESGEEIVNRFLVANIDGGQAETPLVTVAAEKIVVADS